MSGWTSDESPGAELNPQSKCQWGDRSGDCLALARSLQLRAAGPKEGSLRKVVTATAQMTYAIYSSRLNAFQIGLSFRKFRGNGKALLESALRDALEGEATSAKVETAS